jgi:L-aminoadipate-semialdehyde dehydrogenase
MRVIWSHVLADSIPAHAIPLDENFFDLGGHSILATRLIFEIRKAFVVEDAPLGWIFERPTIRELAAAVDELRNADMGLTFKENGDPLMTSAVLPGAPGEALQAKPPAAPALEYGADCEILLSELRETYAAVPADFASRPLTVFLTGATGFLGAFVLRELLRHEGKVGKVVCLIRGSDSHRALNRLKESSKDRGVWDDTWVTSQRLEVVVGDLTKEKFGLEMDVYDRVAAEADVVLHNGALVSAFLTVSFSN